MRVLRLPWPDDAVGEAMLLVQFVCVAGPTGEKAMYFNAVLPLP